MALVTRETLKEMLESDDRAYVEKVIGRALVVLFQRQTEAEKSANSTDQDNGVGFASADAKSGSLTAKYFLKHHHLQDWQIENWTRDWRGYPRLCKYHKQLNEVAEAKAKANQG